MCLVPVWICPNCDHKSRHYCWAPRYCNNPLCVRLLSSSSSSLFSSSSSFPFALVDEPCHPSCFSENCGLLSSFRYCPFPCPPAAAVPAVAAAKKEPRKDWKRSSREEVEEEEVKEEEEEEAAVVTSSRRPRRRRSSKRLKPCV
jgi:hypothetical protein